MKATSILAVLAIAALAFVGFGFMQRNGLIAREEAVNQAWANVESNYQRRIDLIPNLVETVKGATKYEGETLVKVTDSRNKLLGMARELKSAVADKDTGKIEALDQAIKLEMRNYFGIAVEAYPQLKATEQFTVLQAELEGTENRINVARRDYNATVATFNTNVRQWGWLPFCSGFKTREPFKAVAGAETAPAVKF